MSEIIKSIISSIQKSNNDAIIPLLNQVPLGVIGLDKMYKLCNLFLLAAFENQNYIIVRNMLQYIDEARLRIDPLPFITLLLINPYTSNDVMKFTLDCVPEKTYRDFFIDLINGSDDQLALEISRKILIFFPHISHNDWDLLYRMTENVEDEEYRNPMLRQFFESKVKETSITAKPDWIKNVDQEPIPENVIQLPSVDDAINLILDHMKINQLKLQVDQTKTVDLDYKSKVGTALRIQYAISTLKEKIDMLSIVKQFPAFDDTVIFREYGPVNTMCKFDLHNHDPNHDCIKFGGCRMLLCKEFETNHEYDDVDILTIDEHQTYIDWYSQQCQVCEKTIAERHYAIRKPLLHGGWLGCYCSFECLKQTVKDSQTLLMIDRIKQQLDTIGIRDR